MVHSHTNITRLGGLAVLITYARNTRVCVRARKVVVARRHGSGDGSRGGDGCRRRGCRPRSSKGSRKYYYLSEIDRKSSSCGSLVFSFSYYRYDNSRNPLRSRRGCRRNSQSSAACITIHYNIILYIVYIRIYIYEYTYYTRLYIRRITYTYIIYGLHPLYYVIYTHIIYYYTI